MVGSPPSAPDPERCRARRLAPRPWLAIVLTAWLLVLSAPSSSQAATDPRILARYRQMLAANPVEGPTLERLWTHAATEGSTDALLAEYAEQAAKGGLSGQMIYGLLLNRAGKTPEAIALFQKAAEAHPESPLPHQSLARLLTRPEEKAEALEAAAARTSGESTELLMQLGEAWMAAGTPEKAITAWEKMVALSPASMELRQRLATLYMQRGMPDKALPHLAVLVEQGEPPAKVAALREMANLHQLQGETALALDALEKALSYTSSEHWLRTELIAQMIRCSRAADQADALEARWQKTADASPRTPALWLQLAELYARDGRLEKELTVVEKAATLLPKDAGLKTRLARLQVRLDQIPAAAEAYDALIAAYPTSPLRADWIFERAEIDIRLQAPDAARTRVAELEAVSKDESISARALAFYQQHRMGKAIEAQLGKPENDPIPLADYLFSQHRSQEARELLQRLIPADGAPEKKAAAYEKISELLKQSGDIEGALEALRTAITLAPDSRARQLLWGDLLLASKRPEDLAPARKAFAKAYALSKDAQEQIEADQRLYRACEGSRTQKKLSDPFPSSDPASSPERQIIGETLSQLKKESEESKAAAPTLRLARWQFWAGDHTGAYVSIAEAIRRDPDSVAARELACTLEQALGYRDRALIQLQKLMELAPDRKEEWLKQTAQLHFQVRRIDEALGILETLAQSGEFNALVDLANGQQQAERWYEALATWERLYLQARGSRKLEILQPMVRAMTRLGMKQRVREVLWSAYQEQTDESTRSHLLSDLIAQCQGRETMPWLLERLEARVKATETTPEAAPAKQALALALKADGQSAAAYRQLEHAALSSEDRATAEEALTKEAENNRDFIEAARHQTLRLALLPRPSAAEWERLALLQEAALDYPKADATRQQLAERFPRDSEALLLCGRYFEKWSQYAPAMRIYRSIRRFDPTNLAAAAGVLRAHEASIATTPAPGTPLDAETRAAAEAILKHTAPLPADQLVLPPEPAPIGNRLRAYLATYDRSGNVTLNDPRIPGTSDRSWRLEAIRTLARAASSAEGVPSPSWLAEWQAAPPGERLWAMEYSGGGKQIFPFLKQWAEEAPDEPGRCYALLWYGLKYHAWGELGDWVWAPERRIEEQEAFRALLGEWSLLQQPIDTDTLFAKASLSQIWPSAEFLASRRRLSEAINLGLKVFGADPSSVRHRGAQGLALVQWILTQESLQLLPPSSKAGETAFALLREIADEPADTLEAPTFAAQRLLFELLPAGERGRWMEQTLKKGKEPGASPVSAALTESLLLTLAGEHAKAKTALQGLVTLRPVANSDAPADERVWHFLLSTGIQFQLWGLPDATRTLWETALADEAAIALQGARVSASASEMKVRLVAIGLARASRSEFRQQVLTLSREQSPNALNQLAAILEAQGAPYEVALVLDTLHRLDPNTPLIRLLAACQAAGDHQTALAAIERWKTHSGNDRRISAPAVITYALAQNLEEGMKLAAKIGAEVPDDPRLQEQLALIHLAQSHWKEAEATYRRLVTIQPVNPLFQTGLANALIAQDRKSEALDLLKSATRRDGGMIDTKLIEIYLSLDLIPQARLLAASYLRGDDPTTLIRIAQLFAEHEKPMDALSLLASGTDYTQEARKPKAAFTLMKRLIETASASTATAPAPAVQQRWLHRLRQLSEGSVELESGYYEFTAQQQGPAERLKELEDDWDEGRGSPIAGAWLAATLIDVKQIDAAARLIPALIARPDILEPLLTWLDDKCRAINRLDLSLQLTSALLLRNPDQEDSLLRHLRTLTALGRKNEAIELIVRWQPRAEVSMPRLLPGLAMAAVQLDAYGLKQGLKHDLLKRAYDFDPTLQHPEVARAYAALLIQEADFSRAKRVLRQLFRNPALITPPTKELLADYFRTSGRRLAEEARDFDLTPEDTAAIEGLLSKAPSPASGTATP